MPLLTTDTPIIHSLASSSATALFGAFLAFMAAWFWARNGREYTETREQKKARDESEIKWKEGRLAAEQGLRDAIHTEERGRLSYELKNDGDLARITDILSRFVAVQDRIAAMAERVDWHGKQLDRHDIAVKEIHDQLRGIDRDIKDIIREANKPDAR